MKLTGNPRGVQLAILALVILTGWIACRSRDADAQPVSFASVGVQLRGSDAYSGGLRIGLEQGPWQASIVTAGSGHIDKEDGRHEIEPNLGACGTWHRSFKRFSIGWGGCMWEHGDFAVGDDDRDPGVQLTAAIVLRRTFGEKERLYAELFHVSTGGASRWNAGRNLASVGMRF